MALDGILISPRVLQCLAEVSVCPTFAQFVAHAAGRGETKSMDRNPVSSRIFTEIAVDCVGQLPSDCVLPYRRGVADYGHEARTFGVEPRTGMVSIREQHRTAAMSPRLDGDFRMLGIEGEQSHMSAVQIPLEEPLHSSFPGLGRFVAFHSLGGICPQRIVELVAASLDLGQQVHAYEPVELPRGLGCASAGK